MEHKKGKCDIHAFSTYLQKLQGSPCYDHTQTGVQQRQDLQIFKGKSLGYPQENIQLLLES